MKRYLNTGNDECIKRYFEDVKKTKLLTPEEEIELAVRIQKGDEDAIDELVKSNLRFVISIAKNYQGQGLSLSDLISEGNLGVIKAALRFNPDEGYKFISYAVHWIKQSIIQSLNDNSRPIRLPSNVINRLSKMRRVFENFEYENERGPVTGDVITINNDDGSITEIEYEDGLPSCGSLNDIINEDGNELIEILPDEGSENLEGFDYDENVVKEELDNVLSNLDDRERKIVELYHGLTSSGESLTLEAIGNKFGLTKERVRQIKEKAIRKLRHHAHDLWELIHEEE